MMALYLGLSCILLSSMGCQSGRAWKKIDYAPKEKLLQPEAVQKLQERHERDATLIALEYALATLRNPEGDPKVAHDFLEKAIISFEDLKAPKNMDSAFSQDIDKPYRGRPHERVLATTLLSLLDMHEGRYDMALPGLKNAEFLDARWQESKHGTDSPLIYALKLFAYSNMQSTAQSDIEQAQQGLENALRLHNARGVQKTFSERLPLVFPRAKSMSFAIAMRLFEEALPAVLMDADAQAEVETLFKQASSSALGLLGDIEELLEHGDVAVHYAALEGQLPKEDFKKLISNTKHNVQLTLNDIAIRAEADQQIRSEMMDVLTQSRIQTDIIASGVERGDLVLRFQGTGPSVERTGQYGEIAKIVPSKAHKDTDRLPTTKLADAPNRCGFQGVGQDELVLRLCREEKPTGPIRGEGYRLWSSSYQATSVIGRRFEEILKDRARFKRTTDDLAKAGLTISGQLFKTGGDLCAQGEEACAAGAVLFAAGLVTGIFSLISYGIGAATHPEADNRYVRNLFEYVEVYPAEVGRRAQVPQSIQSHVGTQAQPPKGASKKPIKKTLGDK